MAGGLTYKGGQQLQSVACGAVNTRKYHVQSEALTRVNRCDITSQAEKVNQDNGNCLRFIHGQECSARSLFPILLAALTGNASTTPCHNICLLNSRRQPATNPSRLHTVAQKENRLPTTQRWRYSKQPRVRTERKHTPNPMHAAAAAATRGVLLETPGWTCNE